ncbi:hypothetical protein ABW19_dt0208948 [Dactylella cylindrospora]|nr:hypothetical protein ABW19_dt0208948 [Dactylella cylindrospora]
MDDFLGYTPDRTYYSSAEPVPWIPFASPDDPKTPRWSSFIGIIISIIGNIVISFALNIQKYAHIRLAREKSLRLHERKQFKRRRRRRKKQKLAAAAAAGKGVDAAKANGNGNGNGAGLLRPEGNGFHANGNGVANGEEEDLESSWVSTDTYDSPEGEDRGRNLLDDDDERYLLESPERAPDKNGGTTTPPYLRSSWWWAGIILMGIGECGNFLAYGFAPASIVSPLGVVALISNCLIAPLMLKEPFRRRDLLGVVIAITGVGIVVSSSSPNEEKLTPGQIWWEISQTPFEVYFAVTCALIVLLLYLSNIYGSRIILIDLGLVGLFGGYTALATKGVSSLLSSSLYKIVTYPVFYLLVFILGLTAVLQIKYLSRSLQRFDSTQVIPTQFVLFNIFTVTGSAILYRDFEKADASRLTKFFIGILLNFLGVYLISSKRTQSDDSEYDSAISETEDEVPHPDYHTVETPTMLISTAEDTGRYTDHPRPRLLSDASNPPLSSSVRSTASMRRPQPPTSTPSHLQSPPSESSPLLPPLKTSFPYNPPQEDVRPLTRNRSRSPSRPRTHDRPIDFSATTPSGSANPNRSSLSLLTPGPIFVGYQLQAVVADTLKRGVDHIIDDDDVSSTVPASIRGRDRRVRKVKSVGGLGGWLRGESSGRTPRERRRRAGTLEGQSDSTTHPYSVRSSGSRVSVNRSGSAAGSTSGNTSDGSSIHHYGYEGVEPQPGAAFEERRRTIALGEGAADRHDENGNLGRRLSPGIVRSPDGIADVVRNGGDAPLPNPATIPPPTEEERR